MQQWSKGDAPPTDMDFTKSKDRSPSPRQSPNKRRGDSPGGGFDAGWTGGHDDGMETPIVGRSRDRSRRDELEKERLRILDQAKKEARAEAEREKKWAIWCCF